MQARYIQRAAALVAVWALALIAAGAASALTNSNNTPFPSSPVITDAHWSSARRGPPPNEFGDVLPVTWAGDNNMYLLMDDGGTDAPRPGVLWRNSFARISGGPLKHLRLRRIGHAPPPRSWAEIHANPRIWSGPLGSYYSSGLISVNHVFYATQDNDWGWHWNNLFNGLAGIAFSTDFGKHWAFPQKPFPGPTGNLSWVQRGRDAGAPDGYVYAISTEREFNADTLLLGRSLPDPTDMTDPAHWQWASGWKSAHRDIPAWSPSVLSATPIISWPGHITYPRMSFDPGLRRYLLTFTYSYISTTPELWENGSELVILEGPHPWGPFFFVARGPYFGPSNGYDPTIPVKWIGNHGRNIWISWSANFAGCAVGLPCTAGYGFNYQRIRLTLANQPSKKGKFRRARRVRLAAGGTLPPRPRAWRGLPATPPRYQLPRLHFSGRF